VGIIMKFLAVWEAFSTVWPLSGGNGVPAMLFGPQVEVLRWLVLRRGWQECSGYDGHLAAAGERCDAHCSVGRVLDADAISRQLTAVGGAPSRRSRFNWGQMSSPLMAP
jgi:hypothetical protein